MLNTCGGPAPQWNVGQRELDDTGNKPLDRLRPNRFQENLDGDPSTTLHIYMPLGLKECNIFKIQEAT